MLSVVSPAKALDYESPLPTSRFTQPDLLDRSQELVDVMVTKTPRQLAAMMSISDDLAVLNVERFQDWHRPFTPENSRPAMYAFNGDTYQGLDAAQRFGARQLDRVQRSLRILSGLYGVLRPLDLMQPYRLEMGTTVKVPGGNNLYEFWGHTITDTLNEALGDSPGERALINLASNEYFKSVQAKRVDGPVITPKFLDQPINGTPGDFKMISFHAKRARGSMAGWIIDNKIERVADLVGFDEGGYEFDPERSKPSQPVFVRRPR